MPKVLFACAKGIEESELSGPFDILKRAGAEVTLVKVKEDEKDTGKIVETKNGLKLFIDKFIEDVKNETYDMIVCCGGHPNSVILGKNPILVDMLKKQKKKEDGMLQYV